MQSLYKAPYLPFEFENFRKYLLIELSLLMLGFLSLNYSFYKYKDFFLFFFIFLFPFIAYIKYEYLNHTILRFEKNTLSVLLFHILLSALSFLGIFYLNISEILSKKILSLNIFFFSYFSLILFIGLLFKIRYYTIFQSKNYLWNHKKKKSHLFFADLKDFFFLSLIEKKQFFGLYLLSICILFLLAIYDTKASFSLIQKANTKYLIELLPAIDFNIFSFIIFVFCFSTLFLISLLQNLSFLYISLIAMSILSFSVLTFSILLKIQWSLSILICFLIYLSLLIQYTSNFFITIQKGVFRKNSLLFLIRTLYKKHYSNKLFYGFSFVFLFLSWKFFKVISISDIFVFLSICLLHFIIVLTPLLSLLYIWNERLSFLKEFLQQISQNYFSSFQRYLIVFIVLFNNFYILFSFYKKNSSLSLSIDIIFYYTLLLFFPFLVLIFFIHKFILLLDKKTINWNKQENYNYLDILIKKLHINYFFSQIKLVQVNKILGLLCLTLFFIYPFKTNQNNFNQEISSVHKVKESKKDDFVFIAIQKDEKDLLYSKFISFKDHPLSTIKDIVYIKSISFNKDFYEIYLIYSNLQNDWGNFTSKNEFLKKFLKEIRGVFKNETNKNLKSFIIPLKKEQRYKILSYYEKNIFYFILFVFMLYLFIKEIFYKKQDIFKIISIFVIFPFLLTTLLFVFLSFPISLFEFILTIAFFSVIFPIYIEIYLKDKLKFISRQFLNFFVYLILITSVLSFYVWELEAFYTVFYFLILLINITIIDCLFLRPYYYKLNKSLKTKSYIWS